VVVPSPAPGSPSELDRFESFIRRHYVVVALVLIVLIAVPVIIYYGMSYNSVNGTTIQIASVSRTVIRGFFGGISSVTYYVEVHVWSYATSVDTRVNQPSFGLFVNSYSIGSENGGSGTFKPYSYLIYSLTFTTYDSSVASAVGQSTSNYVIVSMDALVSAGIYQSQTTLSDSASPVFSS
jgi:hypothetical protein